MLFMLNSKVKYEWIRKDCKNVKPRNKQEIGG